MAPSFLASVLVGCIALLSHAATAPTVVDGTVSYVGTLQDGVESFLGIKYGQDTGGANRFKHPVPYSYPAGAVVNVTSPAAACPQQTGNPTPSLVGLFSNVTNISEACLTIRVDRPPNTTADARLPVMVYLYGGGYAIGQIYDMAYDPVGLVRETAPKGIPIIYVAINYRVGIFGFAASSALREEENLNSGLLDQYLGLQWVQDHIAAFGGNKDDVTLFGEDVGAASVAFQLTAYGGQVTPTFKRAVLESGPTPAGDEITSGLAENHTAALTELLNCSSSTGDSTAELECLRALPLTTLVDAAVTYSFAYEAIAGLGTFKPTAPSPFIPSSPSKLFKSGQFLKNIDIMIGWTENDGTQFVSTDINNDTAFTSWAAAQWPELTTDNFNDLISLYPAADFSDFASEGIDRNYFRASQLTRDANFVCPSFLFMDAWKRYSPKSEIYLYALNLTIFRVGHAYYNKSYVGTDHFSDIAYVFDYVNVAPYSGVADQSDYNLASVMSGSWAAFAHFSQPTIPGLTANESLAMNLTVAPWDEAFSPGDGDLAVRILGGPRDGMATIPITGGGKSSLPLYDEDLSARCAFWNRPDVLEQTYM